MNKEALIEAMTTAQTDYVWELYYFRINRRRNNPYVTYKVKFRQDTYLGEYANNLLSSVKTYQLDKISDIQEYNGENTKISCDYLSLDSTLIKDNWLNFYNSIVTPSNEKVKGKIQGYFLIGKSTNEGCKSITLFKVGNPIMKLSTNKARFFLCNDDELDAITDDYCRLYLNTDFIVYDSALYTFNLNFERVFDIEKTMKKVKEAGIEFIAQTNFLSDIELFKSFAQEYRSPKTFITLKQERIALLQDSTKRIEIADKLKLKLDGDGKFILDDEEKTSRFIRFLCYKIFKDFNTEDIIEASNAIRLSI